MSTLTIEKQNDSAENSEETPDPAESPDSQDSEDVSKDSTQESE